VIPVNSAGFSLSRQEPAASATTVSLSRGVTPGEFSRAVARAPGLQDAVVDAARDALDGRDWGEVHDLVEDHDLGLADPGDDVGSLLVHLGRGDVRGAWRLLAACARAGQGRRPVDDWRLLPRLLALSDAVTPTVTVRVETGFREVRREHRETIVELLAELSEGAAVRVVGSRLTLRWLEQTHRERLPSVRDGLDTPPSEAYVSDAREALDPDGPHTATLRALREQSSASATYAALADALNVPRETLRSRLSRLRGLDLVTDGYETGDGTAVDLRPAGGAYLDAVDAAVGEQSTLNDGVSDLSKSSDDAVYPANAHGRGEDGADATADGDRDRHRLSSRHDVSYLSRRAAVPPAASAPENGVAVVNYPVEPREDRAETGWSYDETADTLVVSAEWDNPLQYTVCLARAFTDGRVWRHVLDEDRLAEADVDARLDEHRSLLRGCRCLGYLPDAVDDGVEYGERLQEARDELLAMTGDLRRDEYDLPTDEFRSLITREALGLAGTAAHLLDLAGVEVVREVRLPNYSRNFNRGSADGRVDRDGLTKNLATICAIQSTYGEHTGYRQLLEDRPEKVRQSPDAEVDAADPYGSLIGSIVVVGDLGGRTDDLADAIREAVSSPTPREDAPEFAIHVPVETAASGRSWTARTTRRMLRSKSLDATREAVGLLDAFARTPYDVADALAALGSEDAPRDVRQSEVRFALAHLDASRLLTRETAPAARRIVGALLDADRPLSRAALVDRGDVSRSSTYRHLPKLAALDLVEETPEGYRLAVAFHGDDERHADHLPEFMSDRHTKPKDVLYGAALALVDELSRAGDPDDPVFGPWLRPPGETVAPARSLAETWPWVDDWGLATVAALLQQTPPGLGHSTPPAQFGADLEQAPLGTASEPTAALQNT